MILKVFLKYNIWFHIIYTILTYLNLKILYKEKAQITDVFLFTSSSIILMILGFFCGIFKIFFGVDYNLLLIINRTLLFITLYFIKDKIYLTYKKYYSKWNRHTDKKKIRSLTLRNISVISFNLMFYLLNIGLIYSLFLKVR